MRCTKLSFLKALKPKATENILFSAIPVYHILLIYYLNKNLIFVQNLLTYTKKYLQYFVLPLCLSFWFIHSFSILSDDRSKASSKTMPPHSAIQSLLFQMRISSPVLKVIQELLTSSSSSSCHFHVPLYLSFDNLF